MLSTTVPGLIVGRVMAARSEHLQESRSVHLGRAMSRGPRAGTLPAADRAHSRARAARAGASAEMRALVDGEGVSDPYPYRRLDRQAGNICERDPRRVAGLVQITMGSPADRTGPEHDRQLLANLSVR